MRSKRHFLVVEIECLDTQGSHDAEDRLARWLAHFGHTAPSFGFEFLTIGRVASKAIRHKMKPHPEAESGM